MNEEKTYPRPTVYQSITNLSMQDFFPENKYCAVDANLILPPASLDSLGTAVPVIAAWLHGEIECIVLLPYADTFLAKQVL